MSLWVKPLPSAPPLLYFPPNFDKISSIIARAILTPRLLSDPVGSVLFFAVSIRSIIRDN